MKSACNGLQSRSFHRWVARRPAATRLRARRRVLCSALRVLFRVQHHVEYGERLGILGSIPVLGAWNVKKPLPLQWTQGDVWEVACDLESKDAVEYKYVRVDGNGEVQEWCPGKNRLLRFDAAFNEDETILAHGSWKYKEEAQPKAMPVDKAPAEFDKETAHEEKHHPDSPFNEQRRERRRIKSYPVPVDVSDDDSSDAAAHVSGKDVDIGGPLQAPATIYAHEENPILASILGPDLGKHPVFR